MIPARTIRAYFQVAPRAKTYFGDIMVRWKNDQGFKPSQLFGLIGAIVDESSNDGEATITVADAREPILAWYGDLVGHNDQLPLKESLVSRARAVEVLPEHPDAAACAPLVPAIAMKGAEVRLARDHTSDVVAILQKATAICAGTCSVGFGFRRIKAAGGVDGFVQASEVSEP